MPANATPEQLPNPDSARDWEDLTARLRELHEACGRPKYDTLARTSGLAKSAISGLIGVNPLRRPTDMTLSRFVAACLAHAGVAAGEAEAYRARWLAARSRLDEGTATGEPSGEARAAALRQTSHVDHRRIVEVGPAPPPARRWSRRALVTVTFAAAAILAAAAIVIDRGDYTLATPAGSGQPSAIATTSPSPAAMSPSPGAVCLDDMGDRSDARLGRTWPKAFTCYNQTSLVYEWAMPTGKPIGRLRSTRSWFVCWTHGAQQASGSDVWYYTQGDDDLNKHHLQAWGFVPSSVIKSPTHPAPGVQLECPFATRPG